MAQANNKRLFPISNIFSNFDNHLDIGLLTSNVQLTNISFDADLCVIVIKNIDDHIRCEI